MSMTHEHQRMSTTMERARRRPGPQPVARDRGPGAGLAGLAAIALAAAWAGGCKVKDPPPVTAAWSDDFERGSLGGDYYKTGGGYAIEDGVLKTQGSFNHPLWLRKKLPRDVIIEFECWSNTPDGDIKVEVFGDGLSHAKDKGAYTATGYVVLMGGWNNSKSLIARGDEHAKNIPSRSSPKVEIGKRYRWKIKRQGKRLDWWVDDMDTPFLSFEDSRPFEGGGHEYFGFNNWQSDARFDNLTITPL